MLLPLLLAIVLPQSAIAQDSRIVTGTVLDEASQPLFGVTVLVPGTSIGTSTDIDGNFSIKVPNDVATLEFSYIGYSKLSMSIDGLEMNVQMVPDTQVMDEVVVIGYGTQKKDDLTGSITSIGEKDFNEGLISPLGFAVGRGD